MRLVLLIALGAALVACDSLVPASVKRPANAVGTSTDSDRFVPYLNADYDNHEQANTAPIAKTAASAPSVHMQHSLRIVSRSVSSIDWLWQVRTVSANSLGALWLFRSERKQDGSWITTPYRSNDPALGLPTALESFKIVAAQWSALAPCVQSGHWGVGAFESEANTAGCSALLPGLGAGGALLPLKFQLDADVLNVTTFADSARGADARQQARRVRWFDGWSAISGGGPQAQASNKDWHFQQNLRISSEGSAIPIRWRDGAASGYSLVLERVSYPERKLRVLQIDVVEDATGKTLAYGWSDSQAASIGLNLGWLQVGLQEVMPSALSK